MIFTREIFLDKRPIVKCQIVIPIKFKDEIVDTPKSEIL